MNPLQLIRMAKWARHPPSARRVKVVLAVVALCLVLYAVERWIGWPDAFTVDWGRVNGSMGR